MLRKLSLFTRTKPSGAICGPFVLGSRLRSQRNDFLHAYNRAATGAGMEWQVAPREWHSEYSPAHRDTWQFVESTVATAERFLCPLYMNWLSRGAERVAGLFRDAAVFIKQWGISKDALKRPVADDRLVGEFAWEFRITESPAEWDPRFVAYFNAVRLADANGFSGVRLLKHRRDALNTKCDDIVLASTLRSQADSQRPPKRRHLCCIRRGFCSRCGRLS